MDRTRELSLLRALADAPPPDFIEINDWTDSDIIPLMDIFLLAHATSASAVGANHGQDKEEDIGSMTPFLKVLTMWRFLNGPVHPNR